MPGGSLPQTESREEALFVTEYTVHIKNAAVRIPEGGRIYDGTDQIELTYETEITQKEFPLSGTSSARKNRSVSEKDAAEFSPEALQRAVHREGEADPALPQIRVLCSAALDSLMNAEKGIEEGIPEDLLTIDFMEACDQLGLITGQSVGEDLIDTIFSRFCMGK